METITIYKDLYEQDQQKFFNTSRDYAYTKGVICALAEIIKSNPNYVEEKLAEMKTQFEGE